jgi:hypothetical protein
MGEKQARPTVCYLCGDGLANGEELSRDHLPPRAFFPEEFRRRNNLDRLETLRVHKRCNNEYSADEQYFVYALALVCSPSDAGKFLADHVIASAEEGRSLSLHLKIKDEFYRGEDGRVYKTFEHERLYRVAHKIVRGLWFQRAGIHQVLPSTWRTEFAMFDRNRQPPPDLADIIRTNVSWGLYPDVFSFTAISGLDDHLHMFNLVFWQWVLITVTLHDPLCPCPGCGKITDGVSQGSHCERS